MCHRPGFLLWQAVQQVLMLPIGIAYITLVMVWIVQITGKMKGIIRAPDHLLWNTRNTARNVSTGRSYGRSDNWGAAQHPEYYTDAKTERYPETDWEWFALPRFGRPVWRNGQDGQYRFLTPENPMQAEQYHPEVKVPFPLVTVLALVWISNGRSYSCINSRNARPFF